MIYDLPSKKLTYPPKMVGYVSSLEGISNMKVRFSTVTLIFPNAPWPRTHQETRFSLVVVSVWDRFFLGGRGGIIPTQKSI